jgi:hypothetical protein
VIICFIAIGILLFIGHKSVVYDSSQEMTKTVCTRPNNPAPKEWCDKIILKEIFEKNQK